MCEIAKSQRRTYRDQDPPRITDESAARGEQLGRSSETKDDASGYEVARGPPDADVDPDLFGKEQQRQQHRLQHSSRRKETPASINPTTERTTSSPQRNFDGSIARFNARAGTAAAFARRAQTPCVDDRSRDDTKRESVTGEQVPYASNASRGERASTKIKEQVITNGIKREEDSCAVLTNGREMAPVMGVPPPPPPAPHMGPDGLILPRKPYNPCLISNNHKDLRRELLFNQKIGRSVLNQKSELQRALEKQRETTLRREAEKNREETYKDDLRTALQRALEQRAKQIELTEQPQIVEPPNPLVDARAKLRSRTESQ